MSDPSMDIPEPGALLGRGGPVARRLERYEERPQQKAMLAAVAAALEEGRHLLVEAGTGVGKSFGYLIPALGHAFSTGEKVVVSTRTIALQDQLEMKDLPLLQAVLPYEVTAVVAKGRNNYLCRRRLERALLKGKKLFDDPEAVAHLKELKAWAERTADGSRSDLSNPPPHHVWEEVMAESGNCAQRKCPFYDKCFYQGARRRMESARVLVVNHALYFSDLALRIAGAVYLPKHSVVIFDEAHTVEKVATKQLGLELGPGSVEHLLSRLLSERTGKGVLADIDAPLCKQAVGLVREASRDFFREVRKWMEKHDPQGSGRLLGDDPFVPNTLTGPLSALSDALIEASDQPGLNQDDRMELSRYSVRAGVLARTASILLDERPKDQVIWTEGKGKRLKIVASPLEVGKILEKHLYPGLRSCVFTSATLSAGSKGGFSYIERNLGLPEARELQLGSPFPFRENVEIHIHLDMPDPAEGEKWEKAVLEKIRREVLAERGRALVLFTSWRLVEKARSLARELAEEGIPCIFQGEGAVQRLVDRKRRCDEAVLFGTESLWEGIDIPGETLTLVIIPRLPFPVPSSPLVKARSREIQKAGKSPFWEYLLPEAILKFKQGFGRLVRARDDKGRVVILDRRIATKSYGRFFLQALPPCPVVLHRPEGIQERVEAPPP